MMVKTSYLEKKRNVIFKKSIDTLYLDDWRYDYGKYSKNPNKNLLPNVKNIIISKNMIENPITRKVSIENSSAENIYVEDEKDLGGLTINYENLNKMFSELVIKNSIIKSNIKKITIYNKNKIVKIDVLPNMYEIQIFNNNNELVIKLENAKKTLVYYIDEYLNKRIEKKRYKITTDDLDNNNLDLRKFLDYESLKFEPMDINTLIINKKILKDDIGILKRFNIDSEFIYHFYWSHLLSDKVAIKVNNLRIIDDNNMKLLPLDKTFSLDGRQKICEDTKKWIYISSEEDEILIYLDDLNNIKIISKKELLTMSEVEDVVFCFYRKNNINTNRFSRDISLILVKYKNNKYKVIDINEIYEITDSFTKYALNYDKLTNDQKILLKDNDWISLFKNKYFDEEIFYGLCKSYENYKEYLKKINKLGLTHKALIYLKERNITELVNPTTDIKFDLYEEEIDLLNKLGENYIKQKTLKKSGD